MSRCVICNREIRKGSYFCEHCLESEIGEPFRIRRSGLLSLLSLLPFSTADHPPEWLSVEQKLEWVVSRTERIELRFPDVDSQVVVRRLCRRVGLGGAYQTEALNDLAQRKDKKNGPLWAPSDIVVQPGVAILALFASVLGLLIFLTF